MLYINYTNLPVVGCLTPRNGEMLTSDKAAVITPQLIGLHDGGLWSINHYANSSDEKKRIIIERIIESSSRADHVVINIICPVDKINGKPTLGTNQPLQFQNDLIKEFTHHDYKITAFLAADDWVQRRNKISSMGNNEDAGFGEHIICDEFINELNAMRVDCIELSELEDILDHLEMFSEKDLQTASLDNSDGVCDYIVGSHLSFEVYIDLIKLGGVKVGSLKDARRCVRELKRHPARRALIRGGYDIEATARRMALSIYRFGNA